MATPQQTLADARHDIERRLDEFEERLPPIPARVVALGRAGADRINDTACGIATDVGRRLAKVSATASDAWSTTIGQAKSAGGRTATAARTNAKEATGQARAQTSRTVAAAERGVVTMLDDATRAVDESGRPGALEDWTRAELYERAQELDIDGRSGMNKAALIAAIRSV